MHKTLFAPETTTTTTTLLTVVGNPWTLLGCYLLVMNFVTFFVFGLDKWKAKYKETHEKTRRVPEKTLFLLAVMGGSAGALAGMFTFRHKTRKWYFRIGIPCIWAVQILLLIYLI